MRSFKSLLITFSAAAALAVVLMAADHIDAPAVKGGTSDLTDLFVFQSPANPSNLVFVANVQGLLDPTASKTAKFDENSMVEFNIDNNGDNKEDLVIQCVYQGGKLWVYGPVAPKAPGAQSTINASGNMVSTDITAYGTSPSIGEKNGIKAFAGPRDDPFFFDFNQFVAILGGTATGFKNPGTDTFAGTNVMSTVVEVPKSLLGGSGTLNVWVESKKK